MNRVTMGMSVAAALLPLVAAPSASAALEPPLPSPATVLFHTPIAGTMNTTLQGSLCQTPNTCANIPYVPFVQLPFFPVFSTSTNVDMIESAVNSTPGQKILYGYSGGAQTVTEWLRANADDPEAPSPDDLTVVLLANPSRKYGGINAPGSVTPDTQYRVVDVTRQYDYNSDYPTDRFNLLASANIAAGFFFVHLDYSDVDIDDPNNVVWTEGNTTYVFVPTKNLPLLEPLRLLGLTAVADLLNEPLKAAIEQAYDRSYLPVTEPEPTTSDAPAIAASMAPPASAARAFTSSAAKVSDSPTAIAPSKPATAAIKADLGPTGAENVDVSGKELTDTNTKSDVEADSDTATKQPAAEKPAKSVAAKPITSGAPATDGYAGKHRKVLGAQDTNDDGPSAGDKPSNDQGSEGGKTSTNGE